MRILGLSCYYHDSAACLLDSGRIVAAAQEERFTRKKHDANFPLEAVKYCLHEGGIGPTELDAVAFYDKPLLKFHRILETYLTIAPLGIRPYLRALPVWLKEKLWIAPHIEDQLRLAGLERIPKLYYPSHHESHAASAFYPSPFEEAAVLTLDGVGEWSTATIGVGEGARLELLEELRFPHSLGLLYSAFTYFTGFKVNSGEYKLMGLAPYGEPVYKSLILERLMDLKDDGSFRLKMEYFAYLGDLKMTHARFAELFGGPPREPEARITKREMDIAASIQSVCEEIVLRIARHAQALTGKRNVCLAGGVALNCVANGKLLRSGIFDRLWIQPAAGDAGGAVGAAYVVWHKVQGASRNPEGRDAMRGAYLGPSYSSEVIRAYLEREGIPYEELDDAQWPERVADVLAEEKVVGLHQGAMEFGPRALGNRSIIGDPRSPRMQSVMNLKIKYRESFRPFAPSCLEEKAADYFELDAPSPYMLLVADVVESRRQPLPEGARESDDLVAWVNEPRSDIPAVTHVDYSARIQTVSAETNPRYHALLRAFEARTGYGLVVNTSFNVRGEPIVCSPEDAYRCFMRTEMDYLSIGNFLLAKHAQPHFDEKERWQETFVLD